MSEKRKTSGCCGCIGTALVLSLIAAMVAIVAPPSSHRHDGTEIQASSSEDASTSAPAAQPQPSTELQQFDVLTVTNAELPKKVALKYAEEFVTRGGRVTVPAGTRVGVLSRSGEMLRVGFLDGIKDLHYGKTSFADDVHAKRVQTALIARQTREREQQVKNAADAASQAQQAAENAKIESEAGSTPINSPWDGSVSEVKAFLKDRLKDPKSTEYMSWSVPKLVEFEGRKAWAVRVKYRSKNSFNGYVIEEGVALIRHGEVVAYEPIPQ